MSIKTTNIGPYFKLFANKLLGKGSFGQVYLGQNLKTGKLVAVKVEERNKKKKALLELESNIISYVNAFRCEPPVEKQPILHNYWCGKDRQNYYLVTDLLGDNLTSLSARCGGKLSLKTVLMLADQMIDRIRYYHERNIIHRDIKPDNFLIDSNRPAKNIYLIDFGLANKFKVRDSIGNHQHIPYRENTIHVGTVRYMSKNAHLKREQSRRDDMYSLGYVFISLLLGRLPWHKVDEPTRKERYQRIYQLKEATTNSELVSTVSCSNCINTNTVCPAQQTFCRYFDYLDTVDFADEINYNFLQKEFLDCMEVHGYQYDFHWDWL